MSNNSAKHSADHEDLSPDPTKRDDHGDRDVTSGGSDCVAGRKPNVVHADRPGETSHRRHPRQESIRDRKTPA